MKTRFEPTWQSLRTHSVPDWYQDAKFGIFIHWGLYAVPAFGNEWYPRNMYLPGTLEYEHHLKTYGPHTQFGYKDFIPMFKAEKYDAQAWADLFLKSGAKFVVPVAEHHDGFPMYDCSLSEWCAAKMGPKRDLIGELAEAVRHKGMVFGVSSHRAEHWWFMNGGRGFASDVQDPRYADFYGPATTIQTEDWKSRDWEPRPDAKFLDDWLARCCELVDKYRPQVFWFDWWIEQIVFQPYLQKFASYYYNRGEEWGLGVAINYKNYSFPVEAAVWDIERGQLSDLRSYFWQTDTSISKNSWGYVIEQDYKTAVDILCDLIDIVSKNGALLLNIGPRPDGTIPEKEQEILLEMGDWLRVNGEAIYGTRPWRLFGEGPTRIENGSFTDTQRKQFNGKDIRFTKQGNALYAVTLAWPGEEVVIESLKFGSGIEVETIQRVSLLGSQVDLSWSQDKQGLKVKLPGRIPRQGPSVLKIECNQNL